MSRRLRSAEYGATAWSFEFSDNRSPPSKSNGVNHRRHFAMVRRLDNEMYASSNR